MPSELMTLVEMKEHVQSGLGDAALQRIVDAQDAYIRRMVGEHDPDTTMVYQDDRPRNGGSDWGYGRNYSGGQSNERIWLPRPALSIAMVEDRYLFESVWTVRDASEYYLSDEGRSVSRNHRGWGEPFRAVVRVTFTPVSSNAERTEALIDLVRLEVQDTGLASEHDDTYWVVAKDKTKARREAIAPLKHGYRMLA